VENLGRPGGDTFADVGKARASCENSTQFQGQSFCYPSAASSVPSVTGMLSKAVSMSDINLLSDCSDPNGE
jgi:hypothetical protein